MLNEDPVSMYPKIKQSEVVTGSVYRTSSAHRTLWTEEWYEKADSLARRKS